MAKYDVNEEIAELVHNIVHNSILGNIHLASFQLDTLDKTTEYLCRDSQNIDCATEENSSE